jgi:hypothetical protein
MVLTPPPWRRTPGSLRTRHSRGSSPEAFPCPGPTGLGRRVCAGSARLSLARTARPLGSSTASAMSGASMPLAWSSSSSSCLPNVESGLASPARCGRRRRETCLPRRLAPDATRRSASSMQRRPRALAVSRAINRDRRPPSLPRDTGLANVRVIGSRNTRSCSHRSRTAATMRQRFPRQLNVKADHAKFSSAALIAARASAVPGRRSTASGPIALGSLNQLLTEPRALRVHPTEGQILTDGTRSSTCNPADGPRKPRTVGVALPGVAWRS